MLLTTLFLFLGNPRTIIFIIFILVLFFGAKRIPELFKGVGQGVREFKDASTRPDEPANPDYTNQPGYNQPGPNGYPPQNGYNQPGPNQQPPAAYNPNGYPPQYGQVPQIPTGSTPGQPYNPNNTPAS